MKIAILNTLYYPLRVGGAEVSTQLLAESFAEQGHTVSVITLTDGHSATREELNGVTVFRLPLRNLYWPFAKRHPGPLKRLLWHLIDVYNPAARRDLHDLLRALEPDILHTNNLAGFSVAAWDAARALGIPVVHTARDYYLIHPNATLYAQGAAQNPRSPASRLFSFVKRHKSRQVDLQVSISEYVRDLHAGLGYFRAGRREVIYNSIALPETPRRKTAGDGTLTLGYLGRLEPAKGIELALTAFAGLDARFRLLVAGSGEADYVAALQARTHDPRITWLGQVSPDEFFPRLDCLLVPSRWAEPLGRVVLEAYAHGVPVVAADSGGIPEIVRHGRTGYVYPANDPDSLVRALDLLFEQDPAHLRRECLAYARAFSREEIRNRYLGCFTKLLAERPTARRTLKRDGFALKAGSE